MLVSTRLSRQLQLIAGFMLIYAVLLVVARNPYHQLILTLIPIWATLGLSWNLLSGNSGLISFGQASFFGLGAYTVTLLLVWFDVTPWIGIPAAVVVGMVAALVIGYPSFRLRGYYFALTMLAYPLALLNIFEWLGLQEVTLPMKREQAAWFMQFADQRVYAVIALGMLLLALLVSLAVERTRFGLSLLAIKQNEQAAEAAGIPTLVWKMRAIVVSGGMAAAAGGLYAVVLLVVTPDSVFGMLTSAQALIFTMFGGVGTIWGPVVGTVVLIPLSEGIRSAFADILPGVQGVVYGLAIILTMFIAPEGVIWRVRDARRTVPMKLTPPPLRPLEPSHSAGYAAELLRVEGLSKHFGGLKAVEDVSFSVPEGKVLGIIGPNGAGKTTLFNLLNGFNAPTAGRVSFAGRDLVGLKPNQICKLGIGRTFQVVRPFARMSVLQNVAIGAFVAEPDADSSIAAARQALARVGLQDAAHRIAGGLTTKEMRLMELARALAARPRLLLMDETLAGLGADEADEISAVIRRLPQDGTTVVIIEHTIRAMLRLADEFLVLDHGKVLASGRPEDVVRDKSVIEAYLGKKWMTEHAED